MTNLTHTKEEILQRAEEFRAALQEYIVNQQKQNSPVLVDLYKTQILLKNGTKNIKVIRKDTQSIVHCFIDLATGNILKAASWKVPANGVRGNIFDDNYGIGTAVTEYGAAYFR